MTAWLLLGCQPDLPWGREDREDREGWALQESGGVGVGVGSTFCCQTSWGCVLMERLSLVDPVVEHKLGQNRSMITNTCVDKYNTAAASVLWVFSAMCSLYCSVTPHRWPVCLMKYGLAEWKLPVFQSATHGSRSCAHVTWCESDFGMSHDISDQDSRVVDRNIQSFS